MSKQSWDLYFERGGKTDRVTQPLKVTVAGYVSANSRQVVRKPGFCKEIPNRFFASLDVLSVLRPWT